MSKRRIYDKEGHAHFVTFSCYKRRAFLDDDMAKRIVISIMHSQLTKQKVACSGFVIMPDHVHAVVWFPERDQLTHFMKQWKQRSSVKIKAFMRSHLRLYESQIRSSEPLWQRKYYSFNLHSSTKVLEKLNHIHENPVRAGLVDK